jgi:hypothetical protein
VANFPGSADNLPTTITPSTPQSGVHSDLHDKTSDAVNAVETALLPGGAIRNIIDAKAGGTHSHVEGDVTNLTADLAATARFTSASPPRNLVFVPAGTTRAQLNTLGSGLNAAGGGTLIFEPATYTLDGPLLLYSKVNYEFNWSTLKLANGTNTSVFESAQFATSTGIQTNNVDYNIRLNKFIVDGNKANQTAGNGFGVGAYWAGCAINDFIIHDCRGPGYWVERHPLSLTTLPDIAGAVGDFICFYRGGTLYGNGTNGAGTKTGALAPAANNYGGAQVGAQLCQFALDDKAEQIVIYQTGSVATGNRGMLVGQSPSGLNGCLHFINSHIYLNHDVASDWFSNPSYLTADQIEGSNLNMLLRTSGTVVGPMRNYLTFASGTGLRIDAGATHLIYHAQMSAMGSGGIFVNFASGGGFSDLHALCLQSSGTATLVTGTVPVTAAALILNGGGGGTLTGASVRTLGAG